jgi:hypothetical protein
VKQSAIFAVVIAAIYINALRLLEWAAAGRPTAAPIEPPDRSSNPWQRMINRWIHTYHLCSSLGTVPLVLL